MIMPTSEEIRDAIWGPPDDFEQRQRLPVIDAEGVAIARMLEAARGCENWASAIRAARYVLTRVEQDKGLGYGTANTENGKAPFGANASA